MPLCPLSTCWQVIGDEICFKYTEVSTNCWFTLLGWGGAYALNWEPIGRIGRWPASPHAAHPLAVLARPLPTCTPPLDALLLLAFHAATTRST